ncbi:MAG: 2,3-bisphosphoglycerate-independent phosphoglycerate mutase [Mycoplasma sp.]
MKKTHLVCIMDGFGIRKSHEGNAIYLAKKPNLDKLMSEYPNIELYASEQPVGLPKGQMGNSEVGHLNIGCGRIVYQSLTLIAKHIMDKTFFKNEELLKACEHAKNNNSNLHILGLLSDGGVHSHIEQIFATIELANMQGIKNIYIHAFLDGRDTERDSGVKFLDELETVLAKYPNTKLLTISGRYWAMDRDKRWERVQKATNVMINRQGESFTNPQEYVKTGYVKGIFDEFVEPAYNTSVNAKINDNDAIISCNFRPDRMIQLASCLTNPNYDFYPNKFNNLHFVSFTPYADSVKAPYAYKNSDIVNCLGEVLSKNNKTQLRIAETEKYAHVTFFFDGGVNVEYPGEKRILIPSPKVATYDLKPEMSIEEVTNTLIKELDNNYDVVILNFANCDMVGHTGVVEAAVKAVEAVDSAIGKLYQKIKAINGTMFILADHGNADYMLDGDVVITSHSLSPVPFIVTDKNVKLKNKIGKLADVAPTLLSYMGIKIPHEMDGEILIN